MSPLGGPENVTSVVTFTAFYQDIPALSIWWLAVSGPPWLSTWKTISPGPPDNVASVVTFTAFYQDIPILSILPSARQLVRDEGEDMQDRGSGFRRDSGLGWRISLPER